MPLHYILLGSHAEEVLVCIYMDAYAVGCGVLATIEQWYPTRKFNGTMVPHKRNSKVWPGLVTKEKTMKYPTSAICTVCVSLFRHKPGTYNKRNNRVPSWKKAPVCQTCTKHMRGVAKMLEYKQKRNNGRTPFAGVYKFVCERVHRRLWGTCNNRTIVPRKEIQWHNGTPQEKF